MRSYVVAKGIIQSERAVWVHLDHPQMGRIGIAAVYAPNKHPERKALWHKLADTLDKSRQWILGGDFNMVEESMDCKGGSSKILNGGELWTWRRLVNELSLVDSHAHKADHLHFSWDSKKSHRHSPRVQSRTSIGDRVLKRLDRVYNTVNPKKIHFLFLHVFCQDWQCQTTLR